MQLGLINTLTIDRFTPPGAFLEDEQGNEVLLPQKYLLDSYEVGQKVDVFVFKDSMQRIVCTTEEPFILLGSFKYLRVTQVQPIGAFVDWGLDKNLLIPFSEQLYRLDEEEYYLFVLRYDVQTDRLFGSMRVKKSLLPCKEELDGEEVDLLICEQNDLGISVIVNNKYDGMIFDSNIIAHIEPGEERKGYVEKVRPDGKLDIRLEATSYVKYDLAEEKILGLLQEKGELMLCDKSPPDLINAELGMSKRTFKQAIGKLYKYKRIKLNKDSIELLKK
ncbi:MAG: S1-like domain-containing RNA-binding protein [Crocinitomicaceae bacterium]|mgnify:FL=1|jgi:hypothetical protein|tara:strand:+ start:11255 stop:12082 length:828 start_codon:yes stop_codon:yes gene_type:complete